MPDELLDYYNRELRFIRELANSFARSHPKIAERLRLSADDAADDPHVERLIEAFAYLTARIRLKLDDDLPEITESLLNLIYPHYLAPVPSMAIVQFQLDPEQVQLTKGHVIPRHTELQTELIEGKPCQFRTCYPVTLWPIELKQAGLAEAPFVAPETPYSGEATAVLRLSLASLTKEITFAAMGLDVLRLFLRGQPHNVHRLYELLLNHTIGVAVAGSARDPQPTLLERDCVRAVGFERDEGLLSYPARSFLGYRLLTEYFAFPQKFLFVDLVLPQRALADLGQQLEVYLFLNRSVPELVRTVTAQTFPLGCTPIINLFKQRAETISLTHTDFELPVVPDRRLPLAYEIYSIDRVVATPPQGSPVEYRPFFSVKHAVDRAAETRYWHATRRRAEESGVVGDSGTDVSIALVDLKFRPSAPANWTLDVETTCLNRDLPERLPFGGDQPRLEMTQGKGLVARIRCLTPPTRTLRPELGHGAQWRLISHLALNHLSLVDDDQAESFREILKLYDFKDSEETRGQIDGLLSVRGRRVVGPVRTEGPLAFCRGIEVTIRLDEDRFTGGGLFLFASVLERFLALYCTLNSFTKLIATVKGREGELRRWPPRMGENLLV
ncbi:MAG TPA: type VI secretion system baseplate subunit TssF [Isosphaeraceae bacterium]|nr:type VI secretion system baseplate subunit TssF [Isosphaeraceae bacterium]